MAPSTPIGTSAAIASRSASEETPPLATTGPVGSRSDVTQQLEVGPAQSAVLGDVGDHVAGAAVPVESLERLPKVTTLLGPATGRQRRAADVESDGDPVAVLGNRLGAPRGSSSAAVPRLTRRQPVPNASGE